MSQRSLPEPSALPSLVVFGGSFDPPHVAHAMAVVFALSTLPEARVLVVPAFSHALGKKFAASFEDRKRMCELALFDLARTEVSDIERELGGTSRTLDTLLALREREPDTSLRLLIGADILAQSSQWHHFDEVTRLAPPLIVGRPGYASEAPFTLPDIASTALRDDLAQRKSTHGRVAQRVRDWIEEKQLYRAVG